MKIYISYNTKDEPVAAILADSPDKAEVAFMSMKIEHVRKEEIDPNKPGLGMSGVAFIFGSKEVEVGSGMGQRTIRILKRGL